MVKRIDKLMGVCRNYNVRSIASKVEPKNKISDIVILKQNYPKDSYTNVTDKIIKHTEGNLYLQQGHPLSLIRQKIFNFFQTRFVNRRGNPVFSFCDNLSPVVTIQQNFDSLLIPKDHVSRSKGDCYYINEDTLLRAHMTAHQSELIQSGLDSFLMVGDVYRRDAIDKTHYPVFHQLDGVHLRTRESLFPDDDQLQLFETSKQNDLLEKQSCHTLEAVKIMEFELKSCLGDLAKVLFGADCQYRWVNSEFPFTLPSWELEVFHENDWLELLGCGIMRQTILTNAGVTNKIGWAFGLGLERVAMCTYKIPDIRLFWSKDSGFINQFKHLDFNSNVIYKQISQYPQCINDMSFWLPTNSAYTPNDFYDIVRQAGGDFVEQVTLADEFIHPKNGKTSHCYRIVYRHMERTLTQAEVNVVHQKIANSASSELNVVLR